MTGLGAMGIESHLGSFHLGPVDLQAGPGDAVAVIGPSGAGKTTLLRTLAGFVPLEGGALLIDGVDCARTPPEERGLGYVPQGYALFPHLTVLENVRYAAELRGLRDSDTRAHRLLDRFRLDPVARTYPARLSGGERQRVAMARALNAEPRILLWDEPLSALDASTQEALLELLREVLKEHGIPLVIVTHDPPTAFSLADRFLVLEGGRCVFSGPTDELVREPVNTFAARFLGFENVYSPGDLASHPESEFARWLAARAGPEGVCFAENRVEVAEDSGSGWVGIARRSQWTPRGIEVWAEVDSLRVRVLVAGDRGREPAPGRSGRIRINVEDRAVVRMGTRTRLD